MESIGFTANLVPAYHVKNRDRSILRTIVLGGKDTEQLQLDWLLGALKQKKQELTEATLLP